VIGSPPQRRERLDDAVGKIAVDVRVHAGERELQAGNAAAVAVGQQRAPGAGRAVHAAEPGGERRKIKIGEHHVERRQERRVVKAYGLDGVAHAHRDAQVETIEPLDAVAVGQGLVDGRHDGDGAGNGVHGRPGEDLLE
jgi:hypothetical protein